MSMSAEEIQRILPGASELAGRMRSFAWKHTALGEPSSWPRSLQTAAGIMLTSRYAMWIGWGPDLSFLYNDAYARMTLGRKHPWALGQPAQTVWREIWPQIGPLIEHVLKTGEATWSDGLLLLLERSGFSEETYHTFSYSPLFGDDGEIAGMLCVVTEETERIVGERRLQTLSGLASLTAAAQTEIEVLTAARTALSTADKDLPFALLCLFDANDQCALAGHIGLPPGHPMAMLDRNGPWQSVMCERPATQVLLDLRPGQFKTLPTGAWKIPPAQAVIVPIARHGDQKSAGYLLTGLNPHLAYDTAYASFLGLIAGQISDRLENARAHEHERERARSLAELDRAKTAFFANVSHEFRTPLTLIMSPIDELLQGPEKLAETSREMLQVTQRNSLRLMKLVNALLDFSRIEAGRATVQFEATDLSALTTELASVFRAATERAGLKLHIDCPPLPRPVLVDRDMWEKIVLNLLSNAFKFTFEGKIEVRLSPSEDGLFARLSVRDTGVGIPREELPRVFERFHRIEGQRSRSFEGSGIGLALVQELVKLHGGSISAISEIGDGTTFEVSIPFGDGHVTQNAESEQGCSTASGRGSAFIDEALSWLPGTQQAATKTHVPQAGNRQTGRRERVLVVDDNADMRAYLERILSEHWEVDTAQNGAMALTAIKKRRPDLVLTDIMMPDIDGLALLKRLRDDSDTKALPIVLLSARAGEEARIEGIKSGADDYLIKPFSARELIARIDANLKLAQVRRQADARVKGILESISDGFHYIDRDGRFVSFNSAAESMFAAHGVKTSALIGHHIFDEAFPEARNNEAGRSIRTTLKERRPTNVEAYYKPWKRWYAVRNFPTPEGGVATFFQDITKRVWSEERTAGQKRILEMVAEARPLSEILARLMLFVEAQDPGMIGGILLTDGVHFKLGSAPNLPRAYADKLRDAIEAIPNKPPYFASCAEAVDRRTAIVVPDVSRETRFAPEWTEAMQASGLGAVRSTPVFASDGTVLGCLALYFPEAREPDPADPDLVDIATHLAAIAIERERDERALRDSESTLRAFYDNAPVFMGVVEPTEGGDVLHVYDNPQSCAFFGLPAGGTSGQLALEDMRADPHTVSFWLKQYAKAANTGLPVRFEHRHSTDQATRWLSGTVAAIGNGPAGRDRFCYVAEDITERKRAEEQQRLLTNELNHRVKNTLAIVQSIANQTLREVPDPRAFQAAFTQRLMALSRAHNLLTTEAWSGADLYDVVAAALQPFQQQLGDVRIAIRGPSHRLSSNAAVALILALHELATNAVKYGALSNDTGRIEVTWDIDDRARNLRLSWVERGGPKVAAPVRRGFGRRLIEASASQLGGEIDLTFPAASVQCRIVLPFS